MQEVLPDIERRDTIIIGEESSSEDYWVGCCGYYTGIFMRPLLDIPATEQQVSLRFHEFFRIVERLIVEMQALWDIPELMLQSGVWPMNPSLGKEWHVPGPATATQDGITNARNEKLSLKNLGLIENMLFSESGVKKGMELDKYWHPNCNWYGPSGIGTARGITGFDHWHQTSFFNAIPDRAVIA